MKNIQINLKLEGLEEYKKRLNRTIKACEELQESIESLNDHDISCEVTYSTVANSSRS